MLAASALFATAALAVAPTATTNAATSVTATSALLNGSGNPGSEATTGWFRVSTTNPGACDDVFGVRVPSTGGTSLGSGAAVAAYSLSSTGLLPGTTYYFCAITQNGSGTAFGAMSSFSTSALAPTVSSSSATVVQSFSVTLNGAAVPNGSTSTGFFRYATTNPGSCNVSFGVRAPAAGGVDLGAGNASVPFSQSITGLQAGVTYYYCALSTNGVGTSTGNVLQFTTLVAAPAVTTNAASSIGGYSAQLNGTVNPNGTSTTGWFRIASSDPGSCSDAFGTRVPTVGGSSLGSGSSPTAYAQSATLNPGTTYYYCAIAQNSEGVTLGALTTFITPDVPTVTTSPVTSLTATSATLNGSGIPNLAAGTGWFRYSSVNPGTCNDSFGNRVPVSAGGTSIGSGTTSAPFSQSLTGLTPGVTYFYCAIASNSVGTGFGSLLTFTTPPTAPIVTTNSTTLVTGTTATLNGSAIPRGDVSTGWFRYSTTNPVTCNDTFGTRVPMSGGTNLGSGNSTISYLENLTGLTTGTTYYVCAIASNGVGTSVGSVVSFTTQAVPTVTTFAASSIAGTSATLNGQANPNLGATTAWFRFDTSNPGTCNDTFGTRAPTTGGTSLGAGGSPTSFANSVSLAPGTTYYFCAIASNPVGTGFGNVLIFTTPAIPSMTTLTPAPLAATTATLNATGTPNGASSTGYFRYSTLNPMMCDDFFGTRVPSSGGLSLGSGNAPVSYNYALTGLLPSTTYYACAIGNNSVGTGIGNVVTFTTPPTAPLVSTGSVTSITGTTATLNAQANPRGAASTGWFRYSTSNPGVCDDVFGTRAPATGGTALATGLTPGTTYYYCALASNSMGTSVGSVSSFVTPNVPAVTTTAATSVGGTFATLNGTGNPNNATASGWFRYDTSHPGTCNDTFGTRAPASGGTNLGAGASSVGFANAVSGLTPGTTYYFCAISQNLVGTGFGSILSFITPASPTVATLPVTSLTATSVTFNGSANPNGASATGYIRYDTVNPVTCNDTFGTRIPSSGGFPLGGGNAAVPYTQSSASLLPGTTYYYCAIAQNSVGTGLGTVVSFTTPPTAPIVTTNSATSVTAATATLNGTTNPRGDSTTAWFRYDTVSPGTCNDSFGFRVPFTLGTSLGNGNSNVAFSQPLTGLSLATTYYYCAISQNSVGTSFGAVVSFTTSPTAPAVTTLPATSITTTASTLNASVTPNGAATTAWVRYGTVDPGTCSETFGTRAPLSGGTTLGSGTSAVPFSITPTTLTPGATYYYCAIAQNSAGTTFGAVLSFTTTSTPPTLNTLAATSIGGTTATINGSVNANGDATTAWFRYATTSPGTCNDTFGTRTPAAGVAIGSGTAATPFSDALTGLTPGATYYFCAIAQNSLGTVFGLVLTFSTPQAPTTTSNAASPVTATSATLNGAASPNGTSATGWFRYATTNPMTCDDTFGTRTPSTGGQPLGSGNAPISYAQVLSGLQPGTTYYFCALASNTVGTSFGAVLSFTTPPAAPSVAAAPASAIGSTTATFNASANPNGAATTAYFRYSTTSPGTCNDTFGTRAPAGTGGTALTGTTVQLFDETVTGLLPGTTYFFCPIAANAVGTTFGGVQSFTTTAAPTVTTAAATAITSSSATLNGSANPRLDAATGWFRYATTNPGTCDDAFGTRAPATGGTSLGSGGTAVAFTQALTGLLPATTYFVCAIAQNGVGTSFGAVQSFTTTSAPTPTTLAATSVTGTTATLNGNTNPNGASTTAWFRYSTINPGTCNDVFGTRVPTAGTALGAGTASVAHTASLTALTAGTTYYFCAIGSNTNGVGFGSVLTFTTPGAPTVTTLAPSVISNVGATLEGTASPNGGAATGWFRYSTTSPGTCNDTFGTRAPAGSGGAALGSGNVAVPFSQAITGLTQGTTYYVCAISSNAVGTRFGSVVSFVTQSAPTVSSNAASNVGSTSAQLNGTANPRSDATTGYFRYATTSPGTCNDTFGTRFPAAGGDALGSGSSAVSFNEVLTGLQPGTRYYFCALASNSYGTSNGGVLNFTTTDAPAVTTSAVTSILSTGATLNGLGTPNGDAATGYFRYATTNPGTCNDTFGTRAPTAGGTSLGAGTTAVAFSATITGLTPTTTYYVCAVAQNSVGTSFGSVQTFTTPTAPAVTTQAASSVSSTSATLNGSTNPNGLTSTAWFRYSNVDPVTCNDTFGTRAPSTGGTALGAGSTAVAHTQALTGLVSGNTYYFCAIASNSAGTNYGAVLSFTTPGAPVTTTAAATAVTSSSATLNGAANPAGSATTGFFRYATTSPGSCNNTFGTRAPAGSGGTSLGAGFTSSPFSENLSGLAAATTYYYCAIGTNAFGTTFGPLMSFTTAAGPAVATSPASSVTSTTATLNGSASPRGLATTGWFRYASTNPGTCNDAFGTRVPLTGGTALGSGTAAVAYLENLTGLMPGTTYWFCAIAQNSVGTSNGALAVFTTPGPPTVVTGGVTGITSSTATLNATGTPNLAATTGWFRYSTTNPGTCDDVFGTRAPATGGTALGSGTTAVPFTQAITGLQPGTTYYVCAIAQSSAGTGVGTVQTFLTPGAPTVTTQAATAVSGTAATLNGLGNPNLGAAIGYFRYATTNPGTCNDTFGTRAPGVSGSSLGSGSTAVAFSQSLVGLTPGTTYYFCALASNAVATAFGTVMSFRTPGLPIVMTSSASNVMGLQATFNGGANPNGASTTGYFRYSPFDPGGCNDSFGTRFPAAGGTALGSGQTTASFSQTVTTLLPGVTYFFCAIASNSVGTAYGAVMSFSVAAPPPTVTTMPAGDVAERDASLNGLANPRGTAAEGWFRYATTEPTMCDDTFGTRVPAVGGVALGMGNVDAPFTVALTGLKPGITYYYCAIASNQGGASFGAVASFKTPVTKPSVRTGPPTVDGTQVTLTGFAHSNGMVGKAWFQLATERPIFCNATSGQRVPLDGLPLTDAETEVPLSHLLESNVGTFYYCAAIETAGGTAFGDVQQFVVDSGQMASGCNCSSGGELGVLALGLLVLLRRRRR